MSDVDGYFMPRADQVALVALLDEVPALVEDLTIAITRQDRLSGGGPKTRNGSDEQPLPLSVEAMEAHDILHDTLAGWVTLVCEQRHYPHPRNDTLTLARWLKTHIIALALTEGAEESHDEIRHAIRQARRATDRPRERERLVDPVQIYEAGTALLNATEIAKIAATMGEDYQGLNLKRVLRLRNANHIEPVLQTADGLDLYRIADVLTAHLTYPTRKRKAA